MSQRKDLLIETKGSLNGDASPGKGNSPRTSSRPNTPRTARNVTFGENAPLLSNNTNEAKDYGTQVGTLPNLQIQSTGPDIETVVQLHRTDAATEYDLVITRSDSVLRTSSNAALEGTVWFFQKIFVLAYYCIVILTALPQAILAFTPYPKQFFNIIKTSPAKKLIFPFSKLASSLAINAMMNKLFLSSAKTLLSQTGQKLRHPFKRPKDFIFGVFALILGIAAALALGAISLHTFSMLSPWLALSFAGISLTVGFASRFTSADDALSKSEAVLSTDARLKQKMLRQLKMVDLRNDNNCDQIKNKMLRIRAKMRSNVTNPAALSDEEKEIMLVKLCKFIDKHIQVNEETACDKAHHYFTFSLKVIFCTAVISCLAFPYSLTYWEKGKDGLGILSDLISQLANSQWRFEQFSTLTQAEISILTEMATLCLAGTALTDLPNTIDKLKDHLKKNPCDIFALVFLIVANVLAAFSPWNLGLSVISEDNLFKFKDDVYGNTLAALTAVVGFLINFQYSLKKSGLAPEPASVSVHACTAADLVRYVEQTAGQRFKHSDTLHKLQKLSIFADKSANSHEGNNPRYRNYGATA